MTSFSWAELHGALTHIPVAFLLGMAVFEVGALLFRKPEWRVVSFWLLAGAVLIAVPTLLSGWLTGNALRFTGSAMAPPAAFVTHRLFAFTTSGLAIVLLLWRVRAKDRLEGRALYGSIALSLVVAGCVGYTGFLGGRMVFGGPDSSPQETAVKPGGKPAPTTGSVWVPLVDDSTLKAGRKVFLAQPCSSCHRMDGKGGISGPDLTHEARRHSDIAWHIAHLKDPDHMKKGSDMPPFDSLPASDLKALASYLATRK